MITVFVLIIGICGTIYCGYFGYWSWFRPDKLPEKINHYREKAGGLNIFPSFINDFVFDIEKTPVYLWWARIGTILGIVIFLFGLFAYFFGPF
jgi:hypothetical protein